jgi:hypothetical protein
MYPDVLHFKQHNARLSGTRRGRRVISYLLGHSFGDLLADAHDHFHIVPDQKDRDAAVGDPLDQHHHNRWCSWGSSWPARHGIWQAQVIQDLQDFLLVFACMTCICGRAEQRAGGSYDVETRGLMLLQHVTSCPLKKNLPYVGIQTP